MDTKKFNILATQLKNFVTTKLIPLEEEVDNTSLVPIKIKEEMKQMGLFGISIDPTYGGLGCTVRQEIELMFIIGEASPVFQAQFGTNQGLGSYLISNFGTSEQKNKYLPKIASGKCIVSFAATEINAGSDIKAIETRADFIDNSFVINGSKRYITNAPDADIFVTLVKVFLDKLNIEGLYTLFIIERKDGVEVGSPDHKLGQNGANTASINFHYLKVSEDTVLGKIGQGLELCYKNLNKGRLIVAAISTATAKRLLNESIRYAKKRKQFGMYISQFEIIQSFLADIYTEYSVAKAMIEKLADNFTNDGSFVKEFSLCKYYASEMACRTADKALQIFGGEGYMKGSIERFYRDVRLFRIYEGTSEIQQLIIAKHLLK